MRKIFAVLIFILLLVSASYSEPDTKGEKINVLKWWQKKPVYQIYPKSFLDTDKSGTGDIKGVTEKLDYLHSLDVCAIWLTPVYPSPMVDNGYDISDYTDINPLFGSMNDFDELVSEAGKRGIKIVMDLVFNHTSDQHKWFLESKKNRDNPKADWYIWRDAKPDGSEPTNWRAIFGGSAWTWNEDRKQYYLHTFAKEQPDLNWENPDVRHALYEAANFWISKCVGGFRIDAITYIKKPKEFIDGKPDNKDGTVNVHLMTANSPGILDFLREFKREVRDGHDIFTVGEANGVAPEELHNWVGKDGVFDMLFEFSHVTLPFNESEIWCYPREWKLTDLKRALTASQNATSSNGWYPIFFENHDQPRSVNHFFPEGYDTKKAAKVLATILMTLRGTPFIYQGQELGMSNVSWNDITFYDDISSHGQYEIALKEGFTKDEAMKFVRYFSRDNARTPMHWTSGKNAGFSHEGVKTWLPVNDNYAGINAESEEKDDTSVLKWYRKLSDLRKNHEVLITGAYKEIFPESEEIYAFERYDDEDSRLITIANFTDKPVKLPDEFTSKHKIILSSEGNENTSELSPLEARIYAPVL
ncbi:MAG: alpha-glucosidase [Synergistaceae bacterium]|nr:alpha-glucosidase [Synergistaceae bacterium]MBQ3694336.1 alpha-glucosidase [Synergistaceae bacterium]